MTDQIQPQPVPTSFSVATTQAQDGQPIVILQTQTPTGIQVVFLDRDQALRLASELKKQAQTGPRLVVANSLPNGNAG